MVTIIDKLIIFIILKIITAASALTSYIDNLMSMSCILIPLAVNICLLHVQAVVENLIKNLLFPSKVFKTHKDS